MEADVLISEGEFARVYLAFQTRDAPIKTAEMVMIAEGF
jgi:hypothetical protein